jgi:hypothetical protein
MFSGLFGWYEDGHIDLPREYQCFLPKGNSYARGPLGGLRLSARLAVLSRANRSSGLTKG